MIYWTFRLDRLAAQGYLRKGRGENRPHIDVYVVRFLLRRLIQQDADVYLAWHNTHHITGVGRPEMRFRRQARFGGVDCGQYLNRQTLAQLQQEYPVVPYQWVPPRLERVLNAFCRYTYVFVRMKAGDTGRRHVLTARICMAMAQELGVASVVLVTKDNWQRILIDFMRVIRAMDLRP